MKGMKNFERNLRGISEPSETHKYLNCKSNSFLSLVSTYPSMSNLYLEAVSVLGAHRGDWF